MRHVAQQLATYGRNGDTTLVHMSEGEVHGLRALARATGKDLTVNPHTGLPEAFNLTSLLPIAAAFIPGIGPAAAMALGAGIGAATNSERPLMGAVSGALGAYGGSNLVGSVAGLGEGALASQAAGQAAGQAMAAPTADLAAAGVQAGNTAAATVSQGAPVAATAAENPSLYSTAAPNTVAAPAPMDQMRAFEHAYQNTATGGSGAWDTAQQAARTAPLSERYTAGLQSLGQDPSQASELMTMQNAKSIGMPMYGSMMLNPSMQGMGLVSSDSGDNGNSYEAELWYDKSVPGFPDGMPRTRIKKAAGGLASIGQYLRGPGDGMSDDIDATVHDTGEGIRVAASEYVVPADVVSHLGNGSSEAGAAVLDAMGARVRKARTGNAEQGKRINPSKFTPA